MVLTDAEITIRCGGSKHSSMLFPFVPETVREVDGEQALSFGLGAMGYDSILAPRFKVFNRVPLGSDGVVDPKQFNADALITSIETDVLILPPNCYALGETVEHFNMPDNVMALCLAKSTYARCGISVNTTPVWPGFKGHVVIEFYNHLDVPVKIYANEGFAQFVFFESSTHVLQNYASRDGRYSGQSSGIQEAKV